MSRHAYPKTVVVPVVDVVVTVRRTDFSAVPITWYDPGDTDIVTRFS